jgi:hypothetical protein
MDPQKRNFLKAVVISSLFPATTLVHTQEIEQNIDSPVSLIISKNYDPPIDIDSQKRLKNATLKYLQEKLSNVKLPLWNRTLVEIDIEKRMSNIIYWLSLAIEKHKSIYPIDPAWVIAQIMSESYFYEFAISVDLAVGICQFIPNTAKSYEMVYAGSLPQHSQFPFEIPEFANKVHDFHKIRNERRNYSRNNKPDLFTLDEALEVINQREITDLQFNQSEQHLNYMKKIDEFNEQIKTCRDQYIEYLKANIQKNGIEKDVFEETNFFVEFDERFTYKKPIFAMVDMLTKGLRSRHGNILAAAAGYNAGITRTYFRDKIYSDYGKIPAFEETTTYLSRTLINHYEIVSRM